MVAWYVYACKSGQCTGHLYVITGCISGCIDNFALMSGQLTSCFSLSVVADEDNIKDILLTSPLMVSWHRVEHPSDTEDEGDVGLSSEDEAEGLGPEAGVVWRGQASRVGRPEGVAPL